jgi:enoyl-CoA hydratase
MTTFENVLYKSENGICTITINRPDKLNALNRKTILEIGEAMKMAQSDTTIKGIVITGIGPKSFVAGADISEFIGLTAEEGKAMAQDGQTIFKSIEDSSKPVIAAVNGFALGGGCELAMSCHMRIASENAKFGQPEVNLGLIPGYGGTQRLVQYIGKSKASELLMTADLIGAQEALQLGLINYVTTAELLIPKCNEILEKIKSKSPVALEGIIRSVNAFYTDGIDGFKKEVEEFGICFGTEDFKEGTSAFLEKRKAIFTGNK